MSVRRRVNFRPGCEGLESRQLLSAYYILNAASGKVLDDPGFSPNNGTIIQQYQWNGGANQQWNLIPLSNGKSEILNVASGKVLDDPGFSRRDGTHIQQYQWNGGANQQWNLVRLPDGKYEIANAFSGKVLDIPGSSNDNHAPVNQFGWNGGANQRWLLEEVGVADPILSKWNYLRAHGFDPGPSTSPIFGPLSDGGYGQHFSNASIYWSPATGAHEVHGAIRDAWAARHWENGPLGYPTSDEMDDGHGGRVSHFEHGDIDWSPGFLGLFPTIHVTIALPALFFDEWNAARSHGVDLGSPTSPVFNVRDGGQGVHLEHGSIYLSPATGAHEVHGAIHDAWAAQGSANGPLGYPTSDEMDAPGGGRVSHFQYGDIYYTSGFLGIGGSTHTVLLPPQFLDEWRNLRGRGDDLGWPTSGVEDLAGGVQYVDFDSGTLVQSPGSGFLVVDGATHDKWAHLGGVNGPLGLPISNGTDSPAGWITYFQHGAIVSSSPSFPLFFWEGGTYAVSGPIFNYFMLHMSELGPPQGDAMRCAAAWYQVFQHGGVKVPDGGAATFVQITPSTDTCGNQLIVPDHTTPTGPALGFSPGVAGQIIVNPAQPHPLDQFDVQWSETNYGGASAGRHQDRLMILKDNMLVEDRMVDVPDLSPGQTISLSQPFDGLEEGHYRIVVWINDDPYNENALVDFWVH
jgi:hypothetical protein